MLNILIKSYWATVPTMVSLTGTCGLFTGIYANIVDSREYTDEEAVRATFSNLMGYTALGLITGATYPISIPFYAYYARRHSNRLSDDHERIMKSIRGKP